VVETANVVSSTPGFIPSGELELFAEALGALSFGVAAVWLLAGYLGRRYRILTFLCVFAAFATFSGVTFLVTRDWGWEAIESVVPTAMALGFSVVVIALALSLTSWACRGRYHPLRVTLWLMIALVASWFAVTAPFFAIALVASGGSLPVLEVIGVVSMIAGVSFAILLPFLLVSFVNSLFRERLKILLHAQDQPPPILATPVSAAAPSF
jgi:hypothetical protein